MSERFITIKYDRAGDVLYLWTRVGRGALLKSRHGDAGLVWRYDKFTGEPIGLTVMHFSNYWICHLDDLANQIANKFEMPTKYAHDVLETAQDAPR